MAPTSQDAGTAVASATTSASTAIDTISPYATDLNGVSQGINYLNRDIIYWTIGLTLVVILVTRLYCRVFEQLRLLSCLGDNAPSLRYWSKNFTTWWPKVKKHLIYAPIWTRRHNQEIHLHLGQKKRIGFGTVPSRAHFICLSVYMIGNVLGCAWLDYERENYYSKLAELRGRAGFLAVANMVPLFVLAGRNNPLIPLLKLSFDDMNLFHRWVGRMAVVESVVHIVAWAIVKYAAFDNFSGIIHESIHDPFITWGWVAMFVMLILTIVSISPLRHAFYETFLNCHIIMAGIILVGVYLHCKISSLPQTLWVEWIFAFWIAERCLRMLFIIYPNVRFSGIFSRDYSFATVEAMKASEACRVTIHLPKSISVKPGSHAYIRLWGVKFWECHPFSIAWTDENPMEDPADKRLSLPSSAQNTYASPSSYPEKALFRRSMPKKKTTTSVSFIIAAHTGFTRKLYNKAITSPENRFTTSGLLEGPYGGHHNLDSYGTVLLFAGATGITQQLPYIKHLVSSYGAGTIATKRVVLIWTIRDVPALEWVRRFMDEILQLDRRRDVLNIKIFVTRPKNTAQINSPSRTVQMFPGRPNLGDIIREEAASQIGAMCVSVCGPGSMGDSVREAVREVQEDSVVDMIEESFTW